MSMGMDMGSGMSAPLSPEGVDFSNETQAMGFLGEMLDDTVFQVVGNAYARYFWYGTAVVIGIAALVNLAQTLIAKSRLRAAAANRSYPARPASFITKVFATITAVSREISYPQFTPTKAVFWLKLPSTGTTLLLITYLSFILALEFINNDIPGAQHYTALGLRASWLAIAQVPLLILLAGKNNLIGLVTGVSYERLNVLHRWVSRVLLLLATLHFGYQSYGWNQYGLMQLEWATDTCPPTGIAAYAVLLWLNLSTIAPIRNFSYEFFVVQHIISFFGCIIAVMWHLPSTAYYSRVYIYIPIALWLIDRIVRSLRYAYHNVRPGKATTIEMPGGVTRIEVRANNIKRWSPGTHVLLGMPRFGIAQSHPATILSTPTSHDGRLIFLLKSRKGFTQRLLKSAITSETSLLSARQNEVTLPQTSYLALIDGPYGASHADFATFDTVVLFAGSTGITFTLPIMLDIAQRAESINLPVRRLEFIWLVKQTSWLTWASEELFNAFTKLTQAGIEVSFSLFVTCDEKFTDASWQPKACGCQCADSLDKCCCTTTEFNDDTIEAVNATYGREGAGGSASSKSMKKAYKGPNDTMRCFNARSGRPDIHSMLWGLLDQAQGETGIAVCGPIGLNTALRNSVALLGDQRAVHKGTGAQGIYLHVEGFCL